MEAMEPGSSSGASIFRRTGHTVPKRPAYLGKGERREQQQKSRSQSPHLAAFLSSPSPSSNNNSAIPKRTPRNESQYGRVKTRYAKVSLPPLNNMADVNAAPVVDDVKIDESSVKPDPARRNSLEKHLAQRPERAELVESKA